MKLNGQQEELVKVEQVRKTGKDSLTREGREVKDDLRWNMAGLAGKRREFWELVIEYEVWIFLETWLKDKNEQLLHKMIGDRQLQVGLRLFREEPDTTWCKVWRRLEHGRGGPGHDTEERRERI